MVKFASFFAGIDNFFLIEHQQITKQQINFLILLVLNVLHFPSNYDMLIVSTDLFVFLSEPISKIGGASHAISPKPASF